MSLFTKLANDAFSPVDAAGNKRSVENLDAQRWGTEVERLFAAFQAGGGVIFSDLAAAGASLEYAANQMAWVIGDSTAANNGIYRKTGASGSGSWVRAGDLPYSMIPLTNAGTGTPSAIVATSALPVPVTPGATLFTVNIVAPNTGPVTINGKPLRTNSGNEIVPGGLTAGSISAFLDLGDHYRLLSDQASAVIVAAAEGWAIQAGERADDAENAADRSEGFAAMLSADKIKFKTVPLLLADDLMSYDAEPGKIQVGPGDVIEADGFRYEVAASGATGPDIFETDGGAKLTYIKNRPIDVLAFGAAGDRVTDDYEALQKAFSAVDDGGSIYLPKRGGSLGGYYTSQPLILEANDVTIFSDPSSEYAEGFYSDTAPWIIDARGYGLRVDNLFFMGNGATNKFGTVSGIKIDRTPTGDAETYANIDAVLSDCAFLNMKDCVLGKGRNVMVRGGIMAQSKRGVVGELHTYNGGTVSPFRGWRVLGVRFHNMGSPYHDQTSTDPMPTNLDELDSWCVDMPLESNAAAHIEVFGNNIDVGMAGFYKGVLAASKVDSNIGYLCSPVLVYSPVEDTAAISHSSNYSQSISGNVINARHFIDGRRGQDIADHHIVVNGCRNLRVESNDLHHCGKESVLMTNTLAAKVVGNSVKNANSRQFIDSVLRDAIVMEVANGSTISGNDVRHLTVAEAYSSGIRATGTDISVGENKVRNAVTKYNIPATAIASEDAGLPWQTPSMTNGFVMNSGLSLGYRKRFDGFVEISMAISDGSSGLQAFVLPAGCRPSATVQFSGVGRDAPAYVTVSPSGVVTPNWSGSVGLINIRMMFQAA